MPNLLVKDESKNPFGTIKDRKSEEIIKKAIISGVDKLVLITSGNFGYSLSRFSEGSNIKVTCVVDNNIDKKIELKLRKYSSSLIKIDLSRRILKSEELISLARENEQEVIWDVTNGFSEVYKNIILEIKKEKPDYIICPIGSGEIFRGLYEGIKEDNMKTNLIGVSPKNKEESFADKLSAIWIPPMKIRKRSEIIKLDESEIRRAYETFRKYFNSEPSSAVVYGVLKKLKIENTSKVIIINSGKGR